ncbi:MAG TPA: hypothetical protein VFK05_15675 [Polyangiaceae bacterium]|nr:hypothetical protein [Polyangiaceae bacterium]
MTAPAMSPLAQRNATDAEFSWDAYVFPESHRCVELRPAGMPPDLSKTAARPQPSGAVTVAFDEAKRGRVSRVVVAAHGAGWTSCECLPIVLDQEVKGFSYLDPVYLPPLKARASRERLKFVLIGYFTGREIDLHEYYAELHLPAEWAGHGEDFPDPDERFPEFCLESWCYIVPKVVPGSAEDDPLLKEISLDDQKRLAAGGAPRCK